MSIKYLNGKRLYYAFLSGAREIIQQKEQLNKINVFPVPDGDTGTNLTSTVNNMIQEVRAEKSVNLTLQSMADAALTGARGNSGIIFAQFFNGWANAVGQKKVLSINSFGESVNAAVPFVYKAILNPVEGTMISVIKAWACAIYGMKNKTNDFAELLNSALFKAREALNNTPNQLKVLHDAHVVDAGAKGFVHLLEGMVKFVQSGNLKEMIHKHEESISFAEAVTAKETDFRYRYCAEALLTNLKSEQSILLKQQLESLGDSLIVAGNSRKTRIHIHSNQPTEVFSKLKDFGSIVNQKIDDMQKQYIDVHGEHSSIALVTDSIADIPQTLLDRYQIHFLPISIHFDGSLFLDKLTITHEKFHQMTENAKKFPTSSQPTVKNAENLLSFLCTYYDSVIAIMVSGKLSGTWKSVHQAAQKLQQKGKKIEVIDSRLNSGAQGLLVQKAAEMIAAGKSHEEVVNKVKSLVARTKILVSVVNFKYMVKSGRVSPIKGYIAKLLNVKPIVSLDENGKGIAFAKAFSRKANFNKILKIVSNINRKNPITRYCIVHSQAPRLAEQYRQSLIEILNKEPEYIENASCVVAMASGKGAIAVSFMSE